MTRLAELEAHLGSLAELRDILGAMRSLAGNRMQEAQRSVQGIRRYAESISSALATMLAETSEPEAVSAAPGARRIVVAVTSEQGFVGAYNEHLLDAARAELEPDDWLFVVGTRGAALGHEHGLSSTWSVPLATRGSAATQTVEALSSELYRRIGSGEVDRIAVVFARSAEGKVTKPERLTLLPLDLKATASREQPRQRLLFNLDPATLRDQLVEEYVFALLTEAVVEAVASENAARFVALESARDNVTRRLETIGGEARRVRQSEVTAEVVELAVAARALVHDDSKD